MTFHIKKAYRNNKETDFSAISQKKIEQGRSSRFLDNGPAAIQMREFEEIATDGHHAERLRAFQGIADASPQAKQLRAFRDMANGTPQAKTVAQLQDMEDEESVQLKARGQIKENDTGLPDKLKLDAFQSIADASPQTKQVMAFREIADNSSKAKKVAQLQDMEDEGSIQLKSQGQKKENGTGLPDILKMGVETLSGYSMDDIKVHYNSDKPAQLQAYAYTQGTDIYLGPGQEQHLPHEAWHAVQQKQDRVKPTIQRRGAVNINDDAGLEKEADVMGAKALTTGRDYSKAPPITRAAQAIEAQSGQLNAAVGKWRLTAQGRAEEGVVQRAPLDATKLNLVGESHNKTQNRRNAEQAYGIGTGGGNYWREKDFRYGAANRRGDPDDLIIGYRIDRLQRHLDALETGHTINDVLGIRKYCNRISRDLQNANKFPYQGQEGPMLGSLRKLRGHATTLRTAWQAGMRGAAWQRRVNQKLIFMKAEFNSVNSKYERITGRDSAQAAIASRYARSDAMWIAAATGGQTGLWMVGENHIIDINQLHAQYGNAGTYINLRQSFGQNVDMQGRAAFEPDFDAWWIANQATYPRP